MQSTIDFTTRSPINTDKLTGKNKQVFDWLQTGKTINCVEALNALNVMNLHSRISDLRNRAGVIIYDRFTKVGDSVVKEYSLKKFD